MAINDLSIQPHPKTTGRIADLVYGTVTGLLCGGLKSLWAVGLVMTTGGTGSGSASWTTARYAVWGFLVIPAAVYFSLTASFGASALWTGSPGGRWFDRLEIRNLMLPLPKDQITLAKSAGRGAIGGLVGMAILNVVIVAWLVMCVVMSFLKPGPIMLVFWLGTVIGTAGACALWGGMIGSLIYCRRTFGWLIGIALAAAFAVVCNVLIALVVKI